MSYLPVQELVEMIYKERERTAAVEREAIMARRAADDATRLRAAETEALHVQLKLCLSRAKADTAALQQELKVFHAAEDRLKSLKFFTPPKTG